MSLHKTRCSEKSPREEVISKRFPKDCKGNFVVLTGSLYSPPVLSASSRAQLNSTQVKIRFQLTVSFSILLLLNLIFLEQLLSITLCTCGAIKNRLLQSNWFFGGYKCAEQQQQSAGGRQRGGIKLPTFSFSWICSFFTPIAELASFRSKDADGTGNWMDGWLFIENCRTAISYSCNNDWTNQLAVVLPGQEQQQLINCRQNEDDVFFSYSLALSL